LLDELTALLLEKETIDGFELNDLILKMTGKPPATAFNPVPVPVEGNVVPVEGASKLDMSHR